MNSKRRIYFKLKIKKLSIFLLINKIIYFLVFLVLWLLFAFNTVNNDRGNYCSLYYYINNSGNFNRGIEIGFQLCMKYAYDLGFTYEQFQILIATIFLFAISLYIKEYSLDPLFNLILYAIFPFVLDTIQLRNSLALVFILMAFHYLYKANIEKKKIYVIAFAIFILIASLFHQVALIYLLYSIALYDTKKVKKIVCIVFMAEILTIFLFPRYIDAIGMIFPKVQFYINRGQFSTKLITKFLFLILIVAIPIIFHLLNYNSKKINSFIEFSYRISWISGATYMLYIVDVDFFRIYRNMCLILFIGMVNLANKTLNWEKRILYKILIACVALILCFFFIAIYSNNINNLLLNNAVL